MTTSIQGSHTITIVSNAVQLSTTLRSDRDMTFWFDAKGLAVSNWVAEPRTVTINVQNPNVSEFLPASAFSEIVWSANGNVINFSGNSKYESTTSNGMPAIKIKNNPFSSGDTTNIVLSVSFKITVNGLKIDQKSEITIIRKTELAQAYVPLVSVPDNTFDDGQTSLEALFYLGYGGGSEERLVDNTTFSVQLQTWENGVYKDLPSSQQPVRATIGGKAKYYRVFIPNNLVEGSESFIAKFIVSGKVVGSQAFEMFDQDDPIRLQFSDNPSGTIMHGQSVTTTVKAVSAKNHAQAISGYNYFRLTYVYVNPTNGVQKTLVSSTTNSITLSPAHYGSIAGISQVTLIAEVSNTPFS